MAYGKRNSRSSCGMYKVSSGSTKNPQPSGRSRYIGSPTSKRAKAPKMAPPRN